MRREIAAYLEAAGEFDDPATTVAALATAARARNMSALADPVRRSVGPEDEVRSGPEATERPSAEMDD
jgi:hypothetical protein